MLERNRQGWCLHGHLKLISVGKFQLDPREKATDDCGERRTNNYADSTVYHLIRSSRKRRERRRAVGLPSAGAGTEVR